jgi:hypothetical protein
VLNTLKLAQSYIQKHWSKCQVWLELLLEHLHWQQYYGLSSTAEALGEGGACQQKRVKVNGIMACTKVTFVIESSLKYTNDSL